MNPYRKENPGDKEEVSAGVTMTLQYMQECEFTFNYLRIAQIVWLMAFLRAKHGIPDYIVSSVFRIIAGGLQVKSRTEEFAAIERNLVAKAMASHCAEEEKELLEEERSKDDATEEPQE